jgi:DNA-binding transcriptional regulator YdaS (Cro superfamily)|tara:strand:- start:1698 stop:1892 length:195 start_codon:yes stop_codon:yes gene_type:complete
MKSYAVKLALKALPQSRLAEGLGITTQAISQWRRVPAERVLSVERLTGVCRQDLRPDLYPREVT